VSLSRENDHRAKDDKIVRSLTGSFSSTLQTKGGKTESENHVITPAESYSTARNKLIVDTGMQEVTYYHC